MKTMLAVSLAAATLALSAPSFAAPAAPVMELPSMSQVTPVMGGCGRGWHYSIRYRRCVRNWWWR